LQQTLSVNDIYLQNTKLLFTQSNKNMTQKDIYRTDKFLQRKNWNSLCEASNVI